MRMSIKILISILINVNVTLGILKMFLTLFVTHAMNRVKHVQALQIKAVKFVQIANKQFKI
jgi:hypothetical protein